MMALEPLQSRWHHVFFKPKQALFYSNASSQAAIALMIGLKRLQ